MQKRVKVHHHLPSSPQKKSFQKTRKGKQRRRRRKANPRNTRRIRRTRKNAKKEKEEKEEEETTEETEKEKETTEETVVTVATAAEQVVAKEKKKKEKKEKKKKKKKDNDAADASIEEEEVSPEDESILKTLTDKLVEGAKTGNASQLKSFVSGCSARDSVCKALLCYEPLCKQAPCAIVMLVSMLKAPNNIPEALGTLFYLTRSPEFADVFAETEGALAAVTLFITDTGLLPDRARTRADEYGMGILSNVGHSPEGKKRWLADLVPLKVFLRYFGAYCNRLYIIKYAVNVLASAALVSRKKIFFTHNTVNTTNR